MNINWYYLVVGPWIVLATYWLVSSLRTRKTVSEEPFVWRFALVFVEVLGYVILFSGETGIAVLGDRIFPRSHAAIVVGIILTWVGVALALWARWHLGQYWSGRLTIKEDHKLIRTGPYAYFRHPIYSGFDLAAIGSAIAIDRWRCVVGVLLVALGYWFKARREESMLIGQFGEAYKEHCRHTGFLLPKLW